MVGSRRWFSYTADDGADYAIQLDRSNTEAVNAVGAIAAPPDVGLPRTIKPRYGLYVSNDGLTVRRCVYLTPADFAAAQTGDGFNTQFSNVAITLSSKRGEKVTIPRVVDTGQIV